MEKELRTDLNSAFDKAEGDGTFMTGSIGGGAH